MATRSEALRRAVASLPCAACRIEGYSQAAHSNDWQHGKGRGLKATDAATFPLCADRLGQAGCHGRFDRYELCSRADMPALTAAYLAWTHVELIERGLLTVAR